MAACSATGSIACVRRWKPLAWAGWASPAARIWRIFSMPPARRAPQLYAARRLLRHGWQRLRAGRGQHLVNGNALVARLLRSALDAGVRFQLNAPVVRLLQGPPGVSGAMLRSDSGEIHVEAGAVVLACGGFPHDRQRLAQVVSHAAEGYGHFSAAPPDNQGEGIRLGESVGGQFDTSLRHPLAWAPVSRVTLASGQQLMFPHLVERAKPGVIAVLPNGKRFVNEADSYHDFIAALLAATPAGDTPQAWAAGRSSYAASLRPGPRQTVPVHPHRLAAYRLSAARKHRRSWRSSALSTPMRWRKPLNALTTSPALAKTSSSTAGHQPITAPGGDHRGDARTAARRAVLRGAHSARLAGHLQRIANRRTRPGAG